ncbi:MAG: NADH-quinone oxidoreductase subunit K [Phycisphaerales bacterium]|nr:NADH-quinone oxidoreductase subunit K [Phycisphaerales bacterium]
MTLLLAICVAVIFGVSIYLMLSRELKAVAMGVFLFSHAAHMSILSMSRSPIIATGIKTPPILVGHGEQLANRPPVDPLPQALILTSIVISFAVMAFLLTLLVLTQRRAGTLEVDLLAKEQLP